jgi:multiple sugar transport system permease protein
VLTLTTVLFTLAFVFPLYWMFASALKSPAEFAQPDPTLVPQSFHPETYKQAGPGWTSRTSSSTRSTTRSGLAGPDRHRRGRGVRAVELRPMFGNVVLAMMLASLMLPASALLIPPT